MPLTNHHDNNTNLNMNHNTPLTNHNQNSNNFNIEHHRRRTSTFPGASGGAFLATERLPNPYSYPLRKQNNNCCSSSLMNDSTLAEGNSEEIVLDTKCPSWGRPLFTNQCQFAKKYEGNFLPFLKKRPSRQFHQSLSKKSSSKLKILLTMAMFILAVLTGML